MKRIETQMLRGKFFLKIRTNSDTQRLFTKKGLSVFAVLEFRRRLRIYRGQPHVGHERWVSGEETTTVDGWGFPLRKLSLTEYAAGNGSTVNVGTQTRFGRRWIEISE